MLQAIIRNLTHAVHWSRRHGRPEWGWSYQLTSTYFTAISRFLCNSSVFIINIYRQHSLWVSTHHRTLFPYLYSKQRICSKILQRVFFTAIWLLSLWRIQAGVFGSSGGTLFLLIQCGYTAWKPHIFRFLRCFSTCLTQWITVCLKLWNRNYASNRGPWKVSWNRQIVSVWLWALIIYFKHLNTLQKSYHFLSCIMNLHKKCSKNEFEVDHFFVPKLFTIYNFPMALVLNFLSQFMTVPTRKLEFPFSKFM